MRRDPQVEKSDYKERQKNLSAPERNASELLRDAEWEKQLHAGKVHRRKKESSPCGTRTQTLEKKCNALKLSEGKAATNVERVNDQNIRDRNCEKEII